MRWTGSFGAGASLSQGSLVLRVRPAGQLVRKHYRREEINEKGIKWRQNLPLTLAVLLANGLAMLHTAAAAGRARCPVAEAPLMLSPGADIQSGQRELVVDAWIALVAAHHRLQGREGEKGYSPPLVRLHSQARICGSYSRIALWNAVWAEVF